MPPASDNTLENPQVAYRFDVIVVLLKDGEVSAVRHIRNNFNRATLPRRRR